MSLISGITRGISDAENLVDGFIGGLGDLPVPANFNGTYPQFLSLLQAASFRGVPFGVTTCEGRFGRSIALHEYPFRDTPWPEDLGRATRKFSIQGFMITDSLVYGGGDVSDQIQQLIGAAEANGAGTLVHPTLGRLQVSIPEEGLIVTQRLDGATFAEFTLACYDSGDRTFPAASTSQDDDMDSAADGIDSAASQDFITAVTPGVALGSFVVDMAVGTVTSWVGLLTQAATDATGIFNLAASLPGNFGRFFNGALAGFNTGLSTNPMPPTMEDLIFTATQERAAVTQAGDALITAASITEPSGPPPAAQAAAAALVASIVNPSDGIRLFTMLANFYPAAPTGSSTIGQAAATMQTAMGNLLRRTALAALVRVTDQYQPQSENDANTLRLNVCTLLDTESVIAGDAGDDASYDALVSAKATVSAILDGRGAQLPPMQRFTFPGSLVSLVAAQRIYQDSTRADELVRLADARHPAFMPLSFKALSS
jgi:prophage DNA circulation protein